MSIHFKYDRLITVAVEDSANASIKPSIFAFSPTNACRDMMNRYGLVFNSIDNGFAIYYKEDKTRPVGDQYVSEIKSEQAFIFRFQLAKPHLIGEFKGSLKLQNGRQFYINNLDGNNIKGTNTNLHLDPELGQKDAIQLVGGGKEGKLGWFLGKRDSDPQPKVFDLNASTVGSDPYGVLEIRIKESQKNFNNIKYTIKLKA